MYSYGKQFARAARLALISEETHYQEIISCVREFLEESITRWLDWSFEGNAFFFMTTSGVERSAEMLLKVQEQIRDHYFHFGYPAMPLQYLPSFNSFISYQHDYPDLWYFY